VATWRAVEVTWGTDIAKSDKRNEQRLSLAPDPLLTELLDCLSLG
jgi:hypothetical protein